MKNYIQKCLNPKYVIKNSEIYEELENRCIYIVGVLGSYVSHNVVNKVMSFVENNTSKITINEPKKYSDKLNENIS